jgi:mono/diheme cytochrome c family protein
MRRFVVSSVRFFFGAAAILTASIAGYKISSPAAARTQATTPPSASALYATHCAACHGANMKGGAGPALKSSDIADRDPADLETTIRTTMPLTTPGSLSAAEIRR